MTKIESLEERIHTLWRWSHEDAPLTCRIAKSLVGAEEAALREFARLRDERNAEIETSNDLDATKDAHRSKSTMQRIRGILARRTTRWLLVLLMMGAVTFFFSAVFVAFGMLIVGVIVFLGTVVAVVLRSIGTAMGRVRGRYVRLRPSLDDLEARALHAAREAQRLSCLYSQYMYWAQCIAETIHRPWGSDTPDELRGDDQSGDGLDEDRLPDFWYKGSDALSVVYAPARVSGEDRNVAALDASRKVISRGWMASAYRARRGRWEDDYDPVLRVMSDQLAASPEEDVDVEDNVLRLPSVEDGDARPFRSPLADFTMRYCDGLYADEYRREIRDILRRGLRESLEDKIEHVDSGEPNLSGRSVREFLGGPIESPSESSFLSDRYGNAYTLSRLGHKSWFGQSDISAMKRVVCPDESATRYPVKPYSEARVLASFKLDMSDAIGLDECHLVATDEGPAVDLSLGDDEISDGIAGYG